VKRLVTVVTLAILLVGLILLGFSCAPQATLEISVAGTSVPNHEVTSSV